MTTVVVVGVLWAIGYVLACARFPYARCRTKRCQGGRVYSSNGDTWRDHPRCGGSGKRVRWGRRVYEILNHSGEA